MTMHADAITTLRASIRGSVLGPGDAGYDEARAVWNAMIDSRPAVIVRAADTADVIAAVTVARAHGLPVSVRGGGHNVAGHAVGEGALMIDLSALRDVRVDPERRRAWVAGGATWGDVDRATQEFGLATPGGLISETGVGGLTLSGGIGWLRSRHGLSIDNLVSAEVVTADGRLLRTSADEHPDLLWALRGGGGNFGVVTTFEFALHPVGPTVMFAGPVYSIEAGAAPIRFWRDFLADKHDEVASIVEFSTIPHDPAYPEAAWGRRVYTIAALYAGDAARGEALLQPLREQGELVTDFSGQMSYCDAAAALRHRHPVRAAPQLLEEPIPGRPARPGDRPHARGQRGTAVPEHALLDLELRRGDGARPRRRDGLRRPVDALDGLVRRGLEYALSTTRSTSPGPDHPGSAWPRTPPGAAST